MLIAVVIGMSLMSCLPSPDVGARAATEQPVAIHLTRTAEAAAVQTIEAALEVLSKSSWGKPDQVILHLPQLVPGVGEQAHLSPEINLKVWCKSLFDLRSWCEVEHMHRPGREQTRRALSLP